MRIRFAGATLLTTLTLLAVAAVAGAAAGSTVWEQSTAAQLAGGRLDGTAVGGDGRVRLAPEMTTLWGPDEGIVWALAADGRGGALVALSSPARLVHAVDGRAEPWFISNKDGALITSIAGDGAGGAWFGVAPDGIVMHAADATSARTFARTGSIFVWSLARDAAGALWIGTGVPGALWRATDPGEPQRLLETGDDPVRSIAALPDGGVVIGTGGRGRVIRVGVDGRAFVLHDADESEIVDLVVREDGTIFALAASSGVQLSRAAPRPERAVDATVRVTASPPEGEPPNPSESNPAAANETNTPRPRAARVQVAPGAALYRLDPDGHVTRIWRSAREAPFSLAAADDGVLIGTGDRGRVIVVDERGRSGRLFQLASDQVSALERVADGSLLVGGTGDARVARLGAVVRAEGRYETPPIDAGRSATWGRVTWDAEIPRGGAVAASVRGGNTDEPDETWTDWTALDADRAPRGLPATRWLQVRLDLRASRRGESPSLTAIRVHYRPRNRPPMIDSIEIQPPGVVWTRPPMPSNATQGPAVADDTVARRSVDGFARPGRTPTVRKSYEVGVRTVNWIADDPDGERIEFDLDLRREGDEAWLPLARRVEDGFLSWDSRAVADGRYRVRLRASDRPDNPAPEALTDEQISESFVIDSAAPTLATPKITRDERGWLVRFEATDTTGEIVAAECSIDAGPWRPLRADDGVADSPRERFAVQVPPGDGPPRSVRVRVADASGNLAGAAWSLVN